MKLADTHTILWLTEDDSLLSPNALTALKQARRDGGIALASFSLLEIARLVHSKRVTLVTPVANYLRHLERLCVILPLDVDISLLAVSFGATYPKDPADRVIGATALVHNLPLITKDEKIRASGVVECIW